MIIKILKLACILCFVGLLSACEKDELYTKESFEYDGCAIKYVNHPSRANFYIARCDNTNTLTQTVKSGKSSYQQPIISVESSDVLRKKLADVEAREKALAKLSDSEKEILGVK